MTFILIVSSVTMVLAVHEGHHMNRKGVIKWMSWTVVGGIAFLSCQAWEWTHLITGEHAILVNNQLDLMGTTVTVNPWGPRVDNAQIAQALNNTPHDVLVRMAHGVDHTQGHDQLAQMNNAQLASMINTAVTEGHLHVNQPGPVAFGGYFFGITGFHGFHVFSGVMINVVMLIMTINGVFERRGHYLMIEKAGLYWHFVDLVWVFVFLCFYLI
jgi:cytochrome c oxidase subunit 3